MPQWVGSPCHVKRQCPTRMAPVGHWNFSRVLHTGGSLVRRLDADQRVLDLPRGVPRGLVALGPVGTGAAVDAVDFVVEGQEEVVVVPAIHRVAAGAAGERVV